MPTSPTSRSDLDAILVALRRAGVDHATATTSTPKTPGLYAIHGGTMTWRELGLGDPPDGRPLYVGKSESSLMGRDIGTHFANGRTGSSTLRRSLAALLREALVLRGIPRNPAKPAYFSNYGLSNEDDRKLTGWMTSRLTISTWASPSGADLARLEHAALERLLPPLNLVGVTTPWSAMVKAARSVMAQEARSWAP